MRPETTRERNHREALYQAEARRVGRLVEIGETVLDYLDGGEFPDTTNMFRFVDFLQSEAESFHRRRELMSLMLGGRWSGELSRSWVGSWCRGEHERARKILRDVQVGIEQLPESMGRLADDLEKYLIVLRSLVVFETEVLTAPSAPLERAA